MVDSPTAVKGQGESRRDTGRETATSHAVFPADAKKAEKSADVRRFSTREALSRGVKWGKEELALQKNRPRSDRNVLNAEVPRWHTGLQQHWRPTGSCHPGTCLGSDHDGNVAQAVLLLQRSRMAERPGKRPNSICSSAISVPESLCRGKEGSVLPGGNLSWK